MRDKRQLSPKQSRALLALLESPNISVAARSAGVSRASLHRWLATDELFKSEYRRQRQIAFSQTTALITNFSSLAVKTLVEIMTDPSAPTTGRVNSAIALLRASQSGLEAETTSAEVSMILEQIERQESPYEG